MKRYIITEALLGIVVLISGLLFGGASLPAVGGCMLALAAQWLASSDKHPWAVISFGLISLFTSVGLGISCFVQMTSLSRYSDSTSPLTALLILSVLILVQIFLTLPLEDRPDSDPLRRGIFRMVIFASVAFVGIVLTYLLAFVFYGLAVSSGSEVDAVRDFHYLEGVFSLAMIFTSVRGVLMSFLKKERVRNERA